jgi:transcriptional regulator with XRE-family HTH domain
MANTPPSVEFNTQLIAEDMAVKGWSKLDLANRADVSDMTVIRFLRGENQTAKTARKLAKALGFSVRRYIVAQDVAQAS